PFHQLVGDLPHAREIVCAVRRAMAGRASMALEDAAEAAIASLKECTSEEIARLRKLLPAGEFLVQFHRDSPMLLHAAALAEARQATRAHFWEQVQHTAERLSELLSLDRTRAPESISA